MCQIKLRFEESRGIEQFLAMVESYSDANGIDDDKDKIKISIAALDASDHGLVLKSSLSTEDLVNWSQFKSQIISVLGKDTLYYRERYDNFKRENQSPGLALARLTLYYRKMFENTGKLSLTEDDMKHILQRFISSLDNPIRSRIRAEEHILTYRTIAKRVQQLERAFLCDRNPFFQEKTPGINAVIEEKDEISQLKQTMTELQAEIQSQFRLLKNVGESAQRARGYRPVQRTPKRRIPKELYDALEGNCIKHLTSTCSFTPCKYKHEQISQVPRSVIAAAQQYSNTN